MKRYIRFLAITLLFFSYSCNDYFELDRPPQDPWGNIDEFERVPVALYAGLWGGDKWNIPWVNWTIIKNSMGDDVNWVSNAEWGYWRKTKEFNNYTDKNILLLYRPIATANLALEFVEKNNGNPYPTENNENIKNQFERILGEIHFVRAYSYYLLQTTFGHAYIPGGANATPDIPMPLKYAQSVVEAKNPKIGTTEEVFSLIVSDFQKAKELLPEKYESNKHHPSYAVRANRFAASAMLMRTYFLMGDYNKAMAECNYIIEQNKGEYDLSQDPIEAFNKSSISRGKEVILYAPYYDNTLPSPQHLSVINHTWENRLCNWTEVRMGESTIKRLGWMNNPATDTTVNIAARSDKRFTQLFALRYPATLAKPGQETDNRAEIKNITTLWCNKFYRGSGQMNTNVPMIRLAEVYLTRSICRFMSGDKTGAVADLNTVRRRAWDTQVGGPYVEISPAAITLQMINDERIIELFCEGDRVDYLRGLKTDIPRGERGPGADPYTSEDFVWAIPVRETLYNEGL
jgi:hypothetical protein